jgi:crotonobetainyl-CoA:carnitine CoA-transferase CaiB-like acyl-CoA transferase
MLNGMITAMNIRLAQYWGTGEELRPQGGGHAQQMPYGTFRTADKPIVIAITTQPFWKAFCKCIGRDDLADHPSYATNTKRVENAAQLRSEVNAAFGRHNRDHWLSKLVEAGLPCGPVNSVGELVNDEHVLATTAITSVISQAGLEVPAVSPPIYMSETPPAIRKATPSLSADAHEVLRKIDFTEQAIEDLMKRSIVKRPSAV